MKYGVIQNKKPLISKTCWWWHPLFQMWQWHSLIWFAECHQTCMSCSGPDANQCTQCRKGLVLDPNTLLCGVTGDTDCPPRTYLHDDQFTCMGCHQHCYSCEGPGNDECQTCAVPTFLQSEHFPSIFNCIHCKKSLHFTVCDMKYQFDDCMSIRKDLITDKNGEINPEKLLASGYSCTVALGTHGLAAEW